VTAPRTSIVLPTLGRSPLLAECLRSLRAEAGSDRELIVVAQGGVERPPSGGAAGEEAPGERWIRAERPLGFAGAVNLGVGAATAPYVAVMNDDAVVEPGWLAALEAALDADPEVASAQGLNLAGNGPSGPGAGVAGDGRPAPGGAGAPPTVDGRGLAWNRWLQAVQIGHGEPAGEADDGTREVFGVSATAALYRHAALLAVARPAPSTPGGVGPRGAAPEVFDSRLGTYYEDADLALRLRAAGHRALSVPSARVWHAGSLTAGDGVARWRRVHGNRYLVVAGFLGRSFWGRLPLLVLRDLLDLVEVAATGRFRRVGGLLAGWGRAARLLPGFARTGPPRFAPAALVEAPAPAPAVSGPTGAP
jgi:GT2 family glycosyltransferase